MDIELLYFDGCPNWQIARDRLTEALAATGRENAQIRTRLVGTDHDARELDFTGSPTIRVEDRDLFPPTTDTFGLTCRVYPTPDGLAGSPTTDQFVQALGTAE